MPYQYYLLILLFFESIPGWCSFGLNSLWIPEAGTSLSVGIARKDITPPVQVKNWVTGKPYEVVHDPISVRSLVLDDGYQKFVIISWELVDAGESATDEVRNRISRELDIPKYNILVNATHNHSAPWSPVYGDGYRGKERDSWWVVRYMPPQYDDPHFSQWMKMLMDQSVAAVREAAGSLQPASLWLCRSDISEFVHNRRPRPAVWGVVESNLPEQYNYRHKDWDPKVLGEGMRFGPVDRTMTVLSFRSPAGNTIATIIHLSAHAVSIYPYMDGISSDWPGETLRRMNQKLGGECIFLQGTAGDINPWRRGKKAVAQMARELTGRADIARKYSARLQEFQMQTRRAVVNLPLTEKGKETTGLDSLPVEVQVVTLGSLALVTLPGEPMTGIGMAIRERSPFPQTLVLGYANGAGGYYIGMPGEKAYGGYETGEDTNLGTDDAAMFLVNAAEQLLKEEYHKQTTDEESRN